MMISRFTEALVRFYNRYYVVFWLVFALVVLRASYYSLLAACESSLDMQWYPAVQLWTSGGGHLDVINPYVAFLEGDRFMSNGPNYMPFMYFFMMPFAFLDWESAKIAFGLLNIILFLATVFLLYVAGVPRLFLWFVSVLVLFGYTYGNVIGNAQSAIIVGFGVVLAYSFRHKPWIMVIGLSLVCVKHSFALPILLGFFLCGYYKEVFGSALIAFGFVCLFGLKVGASPIEVLHLLSQVNAQHYLGDHALGGPSDLMSLSQKLFGTPYSMISLVIVLVYVSFVVLVWRFKPKTHKVVAASIVLSLLTLPHLGYDHYMLFVAICLASLSCKYEKVVLYMIVLALFLWRGEKIFKPLFDRLNPDVSIHWAMNMGVVFCVCVIVLFALALYGLILDTRKHKC